MGVVRTSYLLGGKEVVSNMAKLIFLGLCLIVLAYSKPINEEDKFSAEDHGDGKPAASTGLAVVSTDTEVAEKRDGGGGCCCCCPCCECHDCCHHHHCCDINHHHHHEHCCDHRHHHHHHHRFHDCSSDCQHHCFDHGCHCGCGGNGGAVSG